MTVTLTPAVDLTLIKLKWRETYVSEGLNKKLIASQPPGIYRGFTLAFDGTQGGGDRRVAITPDTVTSDHVAVYQTSDGFSLTYFDDAGTTILLDLASVLLDSADAVITLLLDYTIGADTTAEFHAYTVADYNALPVGVKSELVILGTVAVPAAGINVQAADISYTRRTLAWEGISRGAIAWTPLLRNPSFEFGTGDIALVGGNTAGEATHTVGGWHIPSTAGNGTFTRDTASPRTGGASMLLNYVATVAQDTRLQQHLMVPTEVGQLIQAKVYVDVLKPSTAGTLELFFQFWDTVAEVFATTVVDTIDTSLVTGGYVLHEVSFVVPASHHLLARAGLHVNIMNVGSTGDALRVDDFQIWLETLDVTKRRQDKGQRMGEVSVFPLMFDDPVDPDDPAAPIMRYDSSVPELIGQRRDRLDEGLTAVTPPVLNWLGQIVAGQALQNTTNDLHEVAQFLAHHLSSAGATSAERTLVLASESEIGGRPTTRLYVGNDGEFELTYNAYWDESAAKWFEDSTAFGANIFKATASGGDFVMANKPNPETTGVGWDDTFGSATGWHSLHLQTEGSLNLISTDSALLVGAGHIQTVALANNARITTSIGIVGGIEYTLVHESLPVGEKGHRRYVSPTGVMLETVNARWNNTTNLWAKDTNGVTAIRTTLSAVNTVGLILEVQEAATNSWADGAWTTTVVTADEAGFDALVAANGNLTATSVVGQINQLYSGVHGLRVKWLSPGVASETHLNDSTGYANAVAGGLMSFQSRTSGGTRYMTWDFGLDMGARLKTVDVYAYVGNAAGEELQGKIFSQTLAGSNTQISTTKTSTASGALNAIGWSTADTDFTPSGFTLADLMYGLWIRMPQTSGAGEFLLFGARITYDHP
jgi:hypothetical protein